MRRILALFLLATSLMLPPQQASATAPNPRTVNLTLKDLWANMVVKSNSMMDNAAAARMDNETVAAENKSGRLLTNVVIFGIGPHPHPPLVNRAALIESIVVLYNSKRHAHGAYLQVLVELALSLGQFKPIKVGPVGAEHSAWTLVLSKQQFPATGDLVLFHRGPYLVYVIGGYLLLDNPVTTLHLAKIVDSRIQKAAH